MSIIHKGSKIAGNYVSGDKLPIGAIVDYDGVDIPNGYEEVEDYLPIYSTTEQVIGTWIDGKPIYRKVIDFGALPDNTTKYVAHNIAFDNLIDVKAIAKRTTDSYSFPLPFVDIFGSTPSRIALAVNSSDVLINTYIDRSNLICYVILEYTKTTD